MLREFLSAVGFRTATPPLHESFRINHEGPDHAEAVVELVADDELHAIAGFTCVIDYVDAHGEGSQRLITCKTYEVKGDRRSICGICHVKKAYRRFIVDRIEGVYSPTTGEHLGDGSFFGRFSVDVDRTTFPTWGLSSSRRQTLLSGLNALAFMARCDGEWHPLEEPIFADFIATMWEAKGWEGEPPICAIMDHVHSLAPDVETFFKAVSSYGRSSTSAAILLSATTALIEADGVVAPDEVRWAIEMKTCLDEAAEKEFTRGGMTLQRLQELGSQ